MLLKKGHQGTNVRVWKDYLSSRGYIVTPSDVFDDSTVMATQEFQRWAHLDDDGIVGNRTILAAKKLFFAGFPDSTDGVNHAMRSSKAGIDFIKSFEKCSLVCYDDGYGFPTIGWGHLVKKDEPYVIGSRITQEKADQLFTQDLQQYEDTVGDLVKVPITQNQYDALVSLAFNIGGRNFKGSKLLEKLNAGDYDGAGSHFKDWVRSNNKVSKGLVRRRSAEAKIFST